MYARDHTSEILLKSQKFYKNRVSLRRIKTKSNEKKKLIFIEIVQGLQTQYFVSCDKMKRNFEDLRRKSYEHAGFIIYSKFRVFRRSSKARAIMKEPDIFIYFAYQTSFVFPSRGKII